MQATATKQARLSRYRPASNFRVRLRPETIRQLLYQLSRYHYLNAPQVLELMYSPGAMSWVRHVLKHLFNGLYVTRIDPHRPDYYGAGPVVYCLSNKGHKFLAELGLITGGYFRPSQEDDYTPRNLDHTLASNWLLIKALRLPGKVAALTAESWFTERELNRDPALRVPVTFNGRTVSVTPDGWIKFAHGKHEMCWAFEMDRGTETNPSEFKKKIARLIRYAQGPYQEAFNAQTLTVLFVTTSYSRMQRIKLWTEEVLSSSHVDDADLFRFAYFDPSDIDPGEAFTQPRWFRPFDQAGQSLI